MSEFFSENKEKEIEKKLESWLGRTLYEKYVKVYSSFDFLSFFHNIKLLNNYIKMNFTDLCKMSDILSLDVVELYIEDEDKSFFDLINEKMDDVTKNMKLKWSLCEFIFFNLFGNTKNLDQNHECYQDFLQFREKFILLYQDMPDNYFQIAFSFEFLCNFFQEIMYGVFPLKVKSEHDLQSEIIYRLTGEPITKKHNEKHNSRISFIKDLTTENTHFIKNDMESNGRPDITFTFEIIPFQPIIVLVVLKYTEKSNIEDKFVEAMNQVDSYIQKEEKKLDKEKEDNLVFYQREPSIFKIALASSIRDAYFKIFNDNDYKLRKSYGLIKSNKDYVSKFSYLLEIKKDTNNFINDYFIEICEGLATNIDKMTCSILSCDQKLNKSIVDYCDICKLVFCDSHYKRCNYLCGISYCDQCKEKHDCFLEVYKQQISLLEIPKKQV